jgi:cellulose synthase/poly-beta-1,6-N-acetylglucosamine synthase-like glycosyltransferase
VKDVEAHWSNILHKLLSLIAFTFEPLYFATIWCNSCANAGAYQAMFIAFEIACALSNTTHRLNLWHRQTTRYVRLDALKPEFPASQWPKVNMHFTHYQEEVEQVKEPLMNALQQEYPAELVVVTILDDGYFERVKDDYKVTETGLAMERMIESALSSLCEAGGSPGAVVKKAREYPPAEPCQGGRPEAAPGGSLVMDFVATGLPRVRLVARRKGASTWAKTGNLENGIWNVVDDEFRFAAFFDGDMVPTRDFLQQMLPPFFEYSANDATSDPGVEAQQGCWRPNWRIGFVSAPQDFRNIERVWGSSDPLHMAQKPYFSITSEALDADGLIHFWGTNAVFFMPALRDAHGFVYNCVTEDTVTGGQVHRFGWASAFVNDNLGVGLARENVAETFDQRKRWRTGNMQQWLMEADPPWLLAESFRYPPYRKEFRAKLQGLYDQDARGEPAPKLASDDCGAAWRRKRRSLYWGFKREIAYFPAKYAFAQYTPPLLFYFLILTWLVSGRPPVIFPDQGKPEAMFIRRYGIQIMVVHWFTLLIDVYAHCARHNYNDWRNASNSVWTSMQETFGFCWIAFLGNIEGLSSAIVGKRIKWNAMGMSDQMQMLDAGPIMFQAFSMVVLVPLVVINYYAVKWFGFGLSALPGPDVQSQAQLAACTIFGAGMLFLIWPVTRCIAGEWLRVPQVDMENFTNSVLSFMFVACVLLIASAMLAMSPVGPDSLSVDNWR